MKFLFFTDLHINNNDSGKRNSDGMYYRVLDVVKNLDLVIDTAVNEGVDLVVFGGDAYKTHRPPQEYKRLFHERILRLATSGIVVVMLVGNHDRTKSPQSKHALDEFSSLNIENVHVIDRITHLKSTDLNLPCQIVGIPWHYENIKIPEFDLEDLPTILTCHCTVWGSEYQTGSEATGELVLGNDFTLQLEDLLWADFVGLGHIHRPQVLNSSPPVLYPGSCDYLTWGEAFDEPHSFVMGEFVGRQVNYKLIPYQFRPRCDIIIDAVSEDDLFNKLPTDVDSETMYRIRVTWESDVQINRNRLDRKMSSAFEWKIVEKKPYTRKSRVSQTYEDLSNMSMVDQLELYFETIGADFDSVRDLWDSII
jgi:DNA repair protein SbcD/Mre11